MYIFTILYWLQKCKNVHFYNFILVIKCTFLQFYTGYKIVKMYIFTILYWLQNGKSVHFYNFILVIKCTYLQFYTGYKNVHFYNFTLVIDTTIQNNGNEISLYFNPMRLSFMNYSV
jgi:hypothetical protein